MPKPQKYQDVIKVLRENGWVLLRQGSGDHELSGIPGATSQNNKHSIPRHRDISAGVIGDLIKKLPNTPSNWR